MAKKATKSEAKKSSYLSEYDPKEEFVKLHGKPVSVRSERMNRYTVHHYVTHQDGKERLHIESNIDPTFPE